MSGCRKRSASVPPAQLETSLADLASRLRERGVPALRSLSDQRLFQAWEETVAAFRDPASPERCRLDRQLLPASGFSRPGLDAALEVLADGVTGGPARELFARAQPRAPGVSLLVLAANLPALLLQPLLPALAARRPLLIKSPSSEPHFAPALLAALSQREPLLEEALAAACWRGGERQTEDPVLAAVDRVIAYGDGETIADLERRAGPKLVAFGPRASLAAVASGAEVASAAGIARDVALFDQRGCLSVQAVYTDGDAGLLASALAAALERLADDLPPGRPDPAAALAVHQLRADAELRGLPLFSCGLAGGTVVVEPEPDFRPSPGLRTVRVHPVGSLAAVPELLKPWRERIQGVALGGEAALDLDQALRRLGITRTTGIGKLQEADLRWWNGGIDPLDVV